MAGLGCNKARRASSFCPLQFLQSWLGRGLPDLVHKLNGSSRHMLIFLVLDE
jgi:hypothetical protein